MAHDYFENAMAFFTDTIYNAIMVSVSGGDISPLVGHNAFLRWSAVKEVHDGLPIAFGTMYLTSSMADGAGII